MLLLDQCFALLESRGVGVFGQSLFAGAAASLPDVDEAIASLWETGGVSALRGSGGFIGTAAGYVHNEPRKPNLIQPRVQAMTRARDREAARALMQRIYDVFTSVTNDDVVGTRWLMFRAVQEPFDMPLASGRARIGCNFEALKRPS
jgi:hypothetical protein